MVQDAPGMEEILGEILAFMEELPLLGHQIQFDYGFLAQAAVNQGIRLEKDGIDTLALCRALMPAGERKNLSSACRYFGIDQENAHRALSDALCAHRLYQKLKEQYPEEENGLFLAKKLRYKAKKERTASKRQKEYLQDLIKYHRINLDVEPDSLTKNQASRLIDSILGTHGRIMR